jgi:hypothetical protein
MGNRVFATVRSLPIGGRGVERGLATLLVGLLVTYGLGEMIGGVTAGVGLLAVHVAVVVGLAFPAVVLIGWARRRRSVPADGSSGRPDSRCRGREAAVAALALAALVAGLATATVGPAGRVMRLLFGLGAAGSLLLCGLVFADR